MPIAPESLSPSIAHLRGIATPPSDFRILAFEVDAIDTRLGAGGLRAGALHEATARGCSLVDDAAATLFLAGIAAREAHASGGLGSLGESAGAIFMHRVSNRWGSRPPT